MICEIDTTIRRAAISRYTESSWSHTIAVSKG
jgi:hypothetical protein